MKSKNKPQKIIDIKVVKNSRGLQVNSITNFTGVPVLNTAPQFKYINTQDLSFMSAYEILNTTLNYNNHNYTGALDFVYDYYILDPEITIRQLLEFKPELRLEDSTISFETIDKLNTISKQVTGYIKSKETANAIEESNEQFINFVTRHVVLLPSEYDKQVLRVFKTIYINKLLNNTVESKLLREEIINKLFSVI